MNDMKKDRQKSYFPPADPESLGIASKGILSFLEDIRRKGIELHSLMVIRHGKCCASGWWTPYGPEYLHPLFSFSKTLTATAIGFAVQEGILSLDDHLVDFFPDQLPEEVSDNLKQVTIHHLLCMSCGQETEITDRGPEWIRTFLAHPFPHKPGTFFKYNTAGTNMLSAILKKKTGQNVTEFLKPRLLDPLGIDSIVCHTLADPDHVEMGGAGMKLTTESMARFTYFLLQRGKWEGKQLLGEEWFDRASSKQIETAGDSENHTKEWAKGYGYQCWMCSLPQSFRADGAYGQFGFVYPTLDLIVVITAATEQTQSLIDSLLEYLIPAVKEDPLPESDDAGVLKHVLAHLQIPALTSCRNPEMEDLISRRTYVCSPDKTCSSMELLIGGCGLFDIEEGEVTQMRFSFGENEVEWICVEGDKEKKITASLAGDFTLCESNGHLFAATARWRSFFALEMEIRRTDALSGTRIIFRFQDNNLTMEVDGTLVSREPLGSRTRTVGEFYC